MAVVPTLGRIYESLDVRGTLTIEGGDSDIVSAGEAVDALLSEHRFQNWLESQPSDTWSVANAYMTTVQLVEHATPSHVWSLELFREVGVPRDWAIGFVDARSGTLGSLEICDDPCRR
jgi:hypothetical protein